MCEQPTGLSDLLGRVYDANVGAIANMRRSSNRQQLVRPDGLYGEG
jgi:hypothetical protein